MESFVVDMLTQDNLTEIALDKDFSTSYLLAQAENQDIVHAEELKQETIMNYGKGLISRSAMITVIEMMDKRISQLRDEEGKYHE